MILAVDEVRARAAALGFTQAGAIWAAPVPTLDAYLRWIEAGMHGAVGGPAVAGVEQGFPDGFRHAVERAEPEMPGQQKQQVPLPEADGFLQS